jgi:hypothetical protein
MNMTIPEVLQTLGPEWAEELNAALEVVDEHDHTSGKGKKVPVAGIDINANLNFQNKKAYNLFSTQFQAVPTVLTGASNANSTSVYNDDLYFTNGAGISVQITSGGSVVSTPASLQTLEVTSINSNLTISPSDTFVFIAVDTTSSRIITLPLASAVSTGRIYVIKDASGLANDNPMTVARQGADLIDGQTSLDLDSNYSGTWFISDGTSNWYRL